MARVNAAVTIPGGVAQSRAAWQAHAMATEHEPKAGGALLAGCILGGAVIGTILHQPSIGVIAGTVLGIAIALLLWWRDRRG